MCEHRAGSSVDLAAQADGLARPFPAQVQVSVLEAGLFAGLVVELERQWRRLSQHLELGGVDLHRTRRDLEVLVAFRPDLDDSGHLHAVFGAQLVRLLEHLCVTEHHLGHAGGIAQVDEDDPAVVAAPGNPTGEGDGLLGVLGSQRAGEMGAQHGIPFETIIDGGRRCNPTKDTNRPSTHVPNRPCQTCAAQWLEDKADAMTFNEGARMDRIGSAPEGVAEAARSRWEAAPVASSC